MNEAPASAPTACAPPRSPWQRLKLPEPIRAALERNWRWMTVVAVLAGLFTDLLKPLAPYAPWLLAAALVIGLALAVLVFVRRGALRACAAPLVLCGLLACVMGLTWGWQELAGRAGEETPEARIEKSVATGNEKLDELIRLVGAEKGVPLPVLAAILAGFGEADVALDAGEIQRRLEAKADDFRELDARLQRLTSDDPAVVRLREAARKLLARGDFTAADASLAAAEARDLATAREHQDRLNQKLLSAAASRAERAAAARLRLAYRDAAAHYALAARIAAPADRQAQWGYTLAQADALQAQGEEFGDNAALEEAIRILREGALPLAPRAGAPLDWAQTQNNLGTALWRLGEREAGTARLEEAVKAFNAALEERTRDRVPLQWAGTQNNIGNALWSLGEREAGTDRLEEAVKAYRAALEESTRAHAPREWAMTQNNLGGALQAIGEREAGTARLEEAVKAYRAALEESTRARAPLDWAMTQNNLGNALSTLGGREAGTARLEQAVQAFNAALEEYTRERAPLEWAMTHNNLGNALRALGEREAGTAPIEQAIEAYGAALKEWTRERLPLKWAVIQNNLGGALRALGEREAGTARLEEAVEAHRAALEECTRERVPLDWAMTQISLGGALLRLGEREGGTARLEAAIAAFNAAIEVFEAAGADHYIEMAKRNLAEAEALLRQRRGG